jgi:hypothetical protein
VTLQHALHDRFHLVAQVTARLAVEGHAHERAMSSAARLGSAAATIGRPTTR